MALTNATHNRIRIWNQSFYNKWQASNEANDAADEIIEAPEKHLLT